MIKIVAFQFATFNSRKTYWKSLHLYLNSQFKPYLIDILLPIIYIQMIYIYILSHHDMIIIINKLYMFHIPADHSYLSIPAHSGHPWASLGIPGHSGV